MYPKSDGKKIRFEDEAFSHIKSQDVKVYWILQQNESIENSKQFNNNIAKSCQFWNRAILGECIGDVGSYPIRQDSFPGCPDLNAINDMFENAGWSIK